ncbi:MAG: polysaccharide pyruvyl transferase family protein [Pseudomonadota bacterium]
MFWDRRIRKRPWNDFRYGNAGDVFVREVVSRGYPEATPVNQITAPRLLCIGSIAHKMAAGDVLSGIGARSQELLVIDPDQIHVYALRCPITFDIFKRHGYDGSQVRFLADPGLLIGKMYPKVAARHGRVAFIPHYRERKEVRASIPPGITYIDIDAPLHRLARQIQEAECVYGSSLHGIIFAQALGRPTVFVRPATEEPLQKFEDYYLSVGQTPPVPIDSIANADLRTAPTSPPELAIDIDDIVLPEASFLQARGILC